MFPDKKTMARNARVLMAILGFAPGLWIAMSLALVFRGFKGFPSNDPGRFLSVFSALLAVSILDIAALGFLQTNKKVMANMGRYDPIARVYHIAMLGSILSEALSVFGLLLTLLSGSLVYITGFSIAAWSCILWVRSKFKQNLATLPDKGP